MARKTGSLLAAGDLGASGSKSHMRVQVPDKSAAGPEAYVAKLSF